MANLIFPIDSSEISDYALAMMHEEFLREIEHFLTETDMSPSRFGLLALNDREFVRRLRRGSDVRTRTVEKVKQFMDSERHKVHAA